MALTKTQASALSNDMLLRGVVETIVRDSAILTFLPFMEVTGTAVRYTRETTLPTTNFYLVGDTWTEATPTWTSATAELKILGGDADVDNFLQATYTDTNDLEAEVIASRAKSIAHKFSQGFITGDIAVDSKSFDGIRKLCPAGQTLSTGANGGAITLPLLDQLIDTVKPGKPELLLMSKRTRRALKKVWTQCHRSSGWWPESRIADRGLSGTR
jgi:hypothetical protein